MSNLRRQQNKRLTSRRHKRLSLLSLSIDWQTDVISGLLSKKALRAVNLAWMGWGSARVNLVLVSPSVSQELNQSWRGKDKPTNILSFPFEQPDGLVLQETMLGDLVVCPDVLIQESATQKKRLRDHMIHMLVHGVLHLQGYDHESEDEAQEMESLEVSILQQLGLENPYSEH